MKRAKLPRSQLKRRPTEVHEDSRTARKRTRGDEERAALAEELDALLDEVEGIIEQNEEVLANYKQQGGEHHSKRHSWFEPHGGTCQARRLYAYLARQES